MDRNILTDQTKTNDFKPFGKAMTKITNRTVDKAFEIYLCLYQAVTGTEEEQNIYKPFPPDFFDLIIVDECHRGSAADDAAWRKVLEYCSSATQIGLTATPRKPRRSPTSSAKTAPTNARVLPSPTSPAPCQNRLHPLFFPSHDTYASTT